MSRAQPRLVPSLVGFYFFPEKVICSLLQRLDRAKKFQLTPQKEG